MHESSDGIAEELERQLQLTLATATIAARRTIAAREYAIQKAQRETELAAGATQARIDSERVLATERLRPVFDRAWWANASQQQIADMWQEANSWRDPDRSAATPTIFDHAAHRIGEEVRERSGIDPTQVIALATVQELEHQHQATLDQAAGNQFDATAAAHDAPQGFDDRKRREQLRARLTAAGVPEPAIEARTVADLGQAREAEQAARTPIAVGAEQKHAAARRAGRQLPRQR